MSRSVTYDFSTPIARERTACMKYDLREKMFGRGDVLPMWVADMDFATPEFIVRRIAQRLAHPVFGYTLRDPEYLNAIAWWYAHRYQWPIHPEWLAYCPGVVAGLISCIQAFTKPRERVLIQPPVYHPFFHTVRQNHRELVPNSLVYAGGRYGMDLDLLDRQLGQGVKLAVLCHPHNPVGRVWTRGELEAFAQRCLKHRVLMVSDEIHADLLYPPHAHIPLASIAPEVADHTITLSSASKTFNLAGLICAHAVITNTLLHRRYQAQIHRSGADMGSPLSYQAVKAAYTPEGAEWLRQLMGYLAGTTRMVRQWLAERVPGVRLVEPEATYLLWLDFRPTGLSHEQVKRALVEQAQLGLNSGDMFGCPEGQGFHRMNIACPRPTVSEALTRLARVFGSGHTPQADGR